MSNSFTRPLFQIFPIKKQELLQFFLVVALLFCILFIQNILKSLKDVLVSTLAATEVIPLLKSWFVFPTAVAFVAIYSKLIYLFKPKQVFYLVLATFAIFFAFFTFFLLPSQYNVLSTTDTLALINSTSSYKWFVLIYKNWGCCLFYVIAELWQNIMHAVFFWQFINFIHTVEQSKRFYILFGFFGQTGLIFTGFLLKYSNQIIDFISRIFNLYSGFRQVLCVQILMSIVLILCLFIYLLFSLLDYLIISKKEDAGLMYFSKKSKLSLMDSIKIVIKSRNVRLIMLLLISQGLSISSIEPLFRESIKQAYPNVVLALEFSGKTLLYTGIMTIILSVVGPFITKRFSWFVVAMIPPVVSTIFGILFFCSAIFQKQMNSLAALMAIHASIMTITIGGIHSVFSKSTKYTFFDATKEMFYVPISPEDKLQGKACADVLGSKVGKSISSFLLQAIFLIMPSFNIQSIAGLLMMIFSIASLIWMIALSQMGKVYQEAVSHN